MMPTPRASQQFRLGDLAGPCRAGQFTANLSDAADRILTGACTMAALSESPRSATVRMTSDRATMWTHSCASVGVSLRRRRTWQRL